MWGWSACPRSGKGSLPSCLAHELGYSLGQKNLGESTTVMLCLDAQDVATCCSSGTASSSTACCVAALQSRMPSVLSVT